MNEVGLSPEEIGEGPDLFGPDPGTDPLAHYYPPDPEADIFAAASGDDSASWHAFAAGLSAQCQCELGSLQPFLDRHVEDLGLAFRLTGDEHERAWPLNPMPIFIGAKEWQSIEEGLIQRADLLEAVIADIYGPQNLVANGDIPAAVISGSRNFARRMVDMRPPGGHHLHVYAVDLARGPTGEWRVLADRVRLPIGIGYALEDRQAIRHMTGGLLAAVGARRQTPFWEALRKGIAASCERAEPRIALLTPGRFNQSYPEQAHLARHLGFSLVEGRDLTVRDGRLFVRTIAGLKRIDALWRWVGAKDIDPLNFDARSQIGVPNLVDAAGMGLVVVNWPGVGVVESRAMPAFLPRIAQTMLGEPLKLPNAATWWCGGEEERAHVMANLDDLVISSAFRQSITGLPDGHTRAGASLTPEEREQIVLGMAHRPMDYTAQEIVSLSTTPALIEGRFEPRGFTLRAFLARDEDGRWVALPGGFARISQYGDLRTSLMGMGDISTDVCIVDTTPTDKVVTGSEPEYQEPRREQGLLPSQAADNLYWLGRYGERAHQVVRTIRTLIEQIAASGEREAAASAVTRLANLLRIIGSVPSTSTKWQPSRLVGTALGDRSQDGSVRGLASRARQIALLLRDRLTRDSWRAIQRTMPVYIPGDLESMSGACDQLIERFAALARMTSDGMSRGPAWDFLDMGMCLERGSIILQAVQSLTGGKPCSDDLAALLDLVDGQALYRSRYLAAPAFAPVIDQVLLDPTQPRGFAFQAVEIERHLAALPEIREDGMLERPLRLARQLNARIEGLDAKDIDAEVFGELRAMLAALSDAIDSRYFLQEEAPAAADKASFLA